MPPGYLTIHLGRGIPPHLDFEAISQAKPCFSDSWLWTPGSRRRRGPGLRWGPPARGGVGRPSRRDPRNIVTKSARTPSEASSVWGTNGHVQFDLPRLRKGPTKSPIEPTKGPLAWFGLPCLAWLALGVVDSLFGSVVGSSCLLSKSNPVKTWCCVAATDPIQCLLCHLLQDQQYAWQAMHDCAAAVKRR